MSLNYLATRFECSWPWNTLVMLCDGRIVCGCADPYAHRVLGDVRTASVHDVWSGPTITRLRDDLNAGGSKFCGDCSLKTPLTKGQRPPVRSVTGALPSQMYIQCTAACNISCAQAVCAPETGITRTRQAGMLDFDLFRRVIDRAMADETRRSGPRRAVPQLALHPVRMDDSDEEMDIARRLAAEIGVDRLCWEITDHPEDSYSRRFLPGSPAYQSISREIWDQTGLGNAIPGATPRARIDVRTLVPRVPLIGRAGRTMRVHTRVRNLLNRAFSVHTASGRRLIRLGAQLCDAGGALIDRDFARAWLPDNLAPGSRTNVAIDIPVPSQPGRYAFKFDLVCEGINWFERCGSETTIKPLLVR